MVGWESPEEIVVIGAHLDSWDLGTGAIDDGAGVGITLAALELIKEAGLTPRRTIRLVLWGAEEVGLLGLCLSGSARSRPGSACDRLRE